MNVLESPKAVLYVPAKSSTFSPFSPQRIARKLHENCKQLARKKCQNIVYLFLAVSTALIIRDPLVPGSFTYSSLGGGACGSIGEPFTRLESESLPPLLEGRSLSDLIFWIALLIILGMNRERDDVADVAEVMEVAEERVENAELDAAMAAP